MQRAGCWRVLVSGVFLSLVSSGTVGCGRYLPPIAPELVAPQAVDQVVITPSAEGISFAWVAPDEDRRGKELLSMEGYRVRRKELERRGDETDPDIPFRAVGFVPDTHIQVREKMREEARAQGKVGRRVKVPEELKKFSFLDSTPEIGKTYLYKIVPENQGATEGVAGQWFKVTFKGVESIVTILPSDEVESTTPAVTEKQSAGS